MISKFKITNDFILQIKNIVDFSHNISLDNSKLKPEWLKVLLFPTDDVYLSQKQFEAIIEFMSNIGEESFYCIDNDSLSNYETAKILSTYRTGYEVDKNTSYDQYKSLFLCENVILLSQYFDWIILTEELLDGGIGIFASNEFYTKNFLNYYYNNKDIEKFSHASFETGFYNNIMKMVKSRLLSTD